MPMFKVFRIMRKAWDPADSMAVRQGQRAHEIYPGLPPEGKDLRPTCLTLYYGGVHSEMLQW
jgi:hypothetical protein